MLQEIPYGLVITGLLILINIAAFAAMGLDKVRAQRHEWRVPESTLFLLAVLGGSIGAFAGMRYYLHKTRHLRFTVGLPLILLLQAAAAAYLLLS